MAEQKETKKKVKEKKPHQRTGTQKSAPKMAKQEKKS